MPVDEKALEDFIKKAHDKKYAKKKTRKQAFDDFRKWKDGKLDQETTLPRPPTRGRLASANPKPKPTT
jgi:hypothetical protein|tara:strand:+ start:2961 stop:3164 length:204 start_codon:yes stop_codon:yes gene_type:complete